VRASEVSTGDAGEWVEKVHCWCALHDLLVEAAQENTPQQQEQALEGFEGTSSESSSTVFGRPAPTLQAFFTQMYGADEE
jgi:hypothetical protein